MGKDELGGGFQFQFEFRAPVGATHFRRCI